MQTQSNPNVRAAWIGLAATVAILVTVACDSNRIPIPITPRPVITVTGAAFMEQPGEEARFTATASFLNQPSRDVTAEARWTATGVVQIASPGVIMASRYGDGEVAARYQGATGTAPVRVAPAGSFLVSGTVQSETGFPLLGANVEIASEIGTVNMTTNDALSSYTLPALGAATMRVQVAGFEPDVRQMIVAADSREDVVLPGEPTSEMYTLSISASPSCTMLPADLRQRTYDAQIDEIRQNLFVTVSGADFYGGGPVGFTGTRAGNTVQFTIRAEWDDSYNLIEEGDFGDLMTSLSYFGTAEGTDDGVRIGTTFRGTIGLDGWGPGPQCHATDHQLVLTRVDGR